jgi:N-acetylmuramic acid 6-phosphate etherase
MAKQTTEDRLSNAHWLDRLSTEKALAVMLDSQAEALDALQKALPQITLAVKAADKSLSASEKGRLIYAGAGTSARIAVQDGSELLPTFNWPAKRIAYLIAGGEGALLFPVEGAEDSAEAGITAAKTLNLSADDVVICLAASGDTPYTVSIARTAQTAGALTIGIANNPDTDLLAHADYPVLLETGAEALAGSTRLKAGTAQKICLNLISTQLMVLQGRVKNGLMSEMQPRNEKLRRRHAEIAAMLASEKS